MSQLSSHLDDFVSVECLMFSTTGQCPVASVALWYVVGLEHNLCSPMEFKSVVRSWLVGWVKQKPFLVYWLLCDGWLLECLSSSLDLFISFCSLWFWESCPSLGTSEHLALQALFFPWSEKKVVVNWELGEECLWVFPGLWSDCWSSHGVPFLMGSLMLSSHRCIFLTIVPFETSPNTLFRLLPALANRFSKPYPRYSLPVSLCLILD